METHFPAERSAILLVEFQNQWTLRGPYHRLIREQLESRQVVANTEVLVTRAREWGARIVHAPLVVDPGRKKGWLAHVTFGKVFTGGTWKAAITEGLFEAGDHVVRDRYAFDAFTGTQLERMLRELSITHLFICGFTTDQCVSRTLRTALVKGFDGRLVSDCTATFSPWLQRRAEKRLGPRVVGHRELLAAMAAPPRAQAASGSLRGRRGEFVRETDRAVMPRPFRYHSRPMETLRTDPMRVAWVPSARRGPAHEPRLTAAATQRRAPDARRRAVDRAEDDELVVVGSARTDVAPHAEGERRDRSRSRCRALRQVAAVSWSTSGDSSLANGGTMGSSKAPVAMTTARAARTSPLSKSTSSIRREVRRSAPKSARRGLT